MMRYVYYQGYLKGLLGLLGLVRGCMYYQSRQKPFFETARWEGEGRYTRRNESYRTPAFQPIYIYIYIIYHH